MFWLWWLLLWFDGLIRISGFGITISLQCKLVPTSIWAIFWTNATRLVLIMYLDILIFELCQTTVCELRTAKSLQIWNMKIQKLFHHLCWIQIWNSCLWGYAMKLKILKSRDENEWDESEENSLQHTWSIEKAPTYLSVAELSHSHGPNWLVIPELNKHFAMLVLIRFLWNTQSQNATPTVSPH